MKKVFFILSAVSLIYFTGCSGHKFYSVEPDEEGYDYYQGRKILSKMINDVSVSVNYEYRDGGNFVYYLYAINNSGEIIIMEPENICAKQTDVAHKTILVNPLNPENEIETLHRNQLDLDDSHSTNVGMNCLFATIDVVADVAGGEEEEVLDDAGYWADEMAYEHESYEMESARLMENRKFWENEALRTTTLYPGEDVGGLVFFPINVESTRIKIVVQLGGNEYEFGFLQTVRE